MPQKYRTPSGFRLGSGAASVASSARRASSATTAWRRWTRSGSFGTHSRKPSTRDSPSSPPTSTPKPTRACPMVIGHRQVSTSEPGAPTGGTTVGWAASARSASTRSRRFQGGRGATKDDARANGYEHLRRFVASARTRQRAAALSRRGRLPTRKLSVQPTEPATSATRSPRTVSTDSGRSIAGRRRLVCRAAGRMLRTRNPRRDRPTRRQNRAAGAVRRNKRVLDSHSRPLPQRMNNPHTIDDEDAPRLRILGSPFTADDEPGRGVRIDVVGTAVRVRHPLQRPMRREGTSLMNARDVDRQIDGRDCGRGLRRPVGASAPSRGTHHSVRGTRALGVIPRTQSGSRRSAA